MDHLQPSAVMAAKRDVARMIDEGAPAGVISAANEAIYCAQNDLPIRACTRDVVMAWARVRQGQDRYGKGLL